MKILFVAEGFFFLEASSTQGLLLCYRKREITCNATFVKGREFNKEEATRTLLAIIWRVTNIFFLFLSFLWTFHLFLKTAKQLQEIPLLLHFLNTKRIFSVF